MREVRPVRLAGALGQETVERSAEHLGAAVAEDALGGGVEQGDPEGLVSGDDRVRRERDDSTEPALGLAHTSTSSRVSGNRLTPLRDRLP